MFVVRSSTPPSLWTLEADVPLPHPRSYPHPAALTQIHPLVLVHLRAPRLASRDTRPLVLWQRNSDLDLFHNVAIYLHSTQATLNINVIHNYILYSNSSHSRSRSRSRNHSHSSRVPFYARADMNVNRPLRLRSRNNRLITPRRRRTLSACCNRKVDPPPSTSYNSVSVTNVRVRLYWCSCWRCRRF